MLTIGFLLESHYVSRSLKTPVTLIFKTDKTKYPIGVQIKDDILNIFYLNQHIWKEAIGIPSSNFGVESVSNIAKIIFMIDAGSNDWCKFVYKEKNVDNKM